MWSRPSTFRCWPPFPRRGGARGKGSAPAEGSAATTKVQRAARAHDAVRAGPLVHGYLRDGRRAFVSGAKGTSRPEDEGGHGVLAPLSPIERRSFADRPSGRRSTST